jgi:protein-disulfide isomerase
MESRKASFADRLITGVLIVALAYALLLPRGPVRTWFAKWSAETNLTRLAKENWGELAKTEARLDTSGTGLPLIIEFGNYQCPYCSRSHSHIMRAIAGNASLGVGFRHLPMSRRADAAALAAVCAEFQGRFRAMHTLLLETEDWKTDPNWSALAREAEVPDSTEFEQCLGGPAARKRLDEDKRLAELLGVMATPTFLSRSGVHVG